MELYHYPYHYVQRFDEVPATQASFLRYRLLYTFKSPKSHQWYWVWVERYDYNLYAVKFHLKAHRDSRHKYSLMTGFNEARPVINTCIAIMQEVGRENPRASFGFIGASTEKESPYFTKRFRVYSRLMATYFTEETFRHYMILSKSAYLLIRKSELEKNPGLPHILTENFRQLYPYFE